MSINHNNGGYHFDEIVARRPNLIENDGVTGLISQVLKQINSSITHTIGPYGTNSIVQNYQQTRSFYVTRDGYTIMKQLVYFDELPAIVKNIIDGVSEYMQNRIGDSTSSGIPITTELYSRIVEEYSPSGDGGWSLSPVGVCNILDKVFQYVISKVFPSEGTSEYVRIFETMTEDEIIEELTRVAGISLNNDFVLGKKFAELYRGRLEDKTPIKIEDGSGVEDEIITDSGFTVRGITVTDFTKMAESTTTFGNACVLEKPIIIVFDGVARENDVEALRKIVKVMAFDMNREILISAENYSPQFNRFIYDCIDGKVFSENGEFLDELPLEKQKPKKIKIACIPIGNKSEYYRDLFKDFMIMNRVTGVISTTHTGDFKLDTVNGVENIIEFINNHSGTCERFIGGYANCSFIGCTPDPIVYNNHVKELKEQLRKLETENSDANKMAIDKLRLRIWDLNSRQAIIKIGAPNESTRKTKRLIYDDAVRSLDTAVREGGICIGGNIAVSHCIEKNMDDLLETVTTELLESKINLCSGAKRDDIEKNTKKIAEIVRDAFGAAYRIALFNMFQNNERVSEIYREVLSSDKPQIFNIVSNRVESFDDTTIIVPITTDLCMIEIVGSIVKELIVTNKMMPAYPPNFKIEEIDKLISLGKQQMPK